MVVLVLTMKVASCQKNATLLYVFSLLKQQPSFMISPPTSLYLHVLFTVFFFFDLFNKCSQLTCSNRTFSHAAIWKVPIRRRLYGIELFNNSERHQSWQSCKASFFFLVAGAFFSLGVNVHKNKGVGGIQVCKTKQAWHLKK
jgi:hypothetical protein